LCILADSETGQVQGTQQVLRSWIRGERVGGKTSGRIGKLLETQRAPGRLERVRRCELRWSCGNGLHCTECADGTDE